MKTSISRIMTALLLLGAMAPTVNAEPQPSAFGSLSEGFAPILGRVGPAVVSIYSTKVVETRGRMNPFFFDPFFREFEGRERKQREQGLGSGVIVSPDGIIMTNNHVVENAEEVRVLLADKRQFKAKVVGTDPKTDIAIIRVEAKNLPFVTFGDSGQVQVGHFAMAIGNPFGLGQTATFGIISAVGRGNVGLVDYEDFLQTDAAINPGNSGGALVNIKGELIGINTAIVSRGAQGNQGIGFAVPSNMARVVMDQVLKTGKVVRGWLGVLIQELTPQMADAMGIKDVRGALVGDITKDSPAEKAGLQRGDLIIELAGKQVPDSKSLRMRIAQTAPGSKVRLALLRNGARKELDVTLGELPDKLAETKSDESSLGARQD